MVRSVPWGRSRALVFPTARDVRLELRAAGRNDLTYFGNDRARRSAPVMIEVHGVAQSEAAFFRNLDLPTALRSVFLLNDPAADGAPASAVQPQNNPAPVLVARLAAAAGLLASENSLVGRPGERVVFGCSGLKHRVSPEGGTLTLTHVAELAGLWVNVLRVEIDRDWTWKGGASPCVTVARTLPVHSGWALTNRGPEYG